MCMKRFAIMSCSAYELFNWRLLFALNPPFSGRQKDVPQKTGTRLNCITFFIFFYYFSLLPVFWGTSFCRPEKGGLLAHFQLVTNFDSEDTAVNLVPPD